jgi:hypothetical protein
VASPAAIQAKIDALEAKVAQFAGIRGTAFGDQSTQFSIDDAHKELARLRGELATAASTSRVRYIATDKGC